MPPRTDSFEGLHVLLVTEDDARAQAIAKALRERRAHVGDVRAGAKDPVALRGADLLVIDARRAAATEARVIEVRSDVRARWASVATIDYATLASGEGTVDLRALEGIVSRLAGMDKALTERARKEQTFETSLAPLGPTRTLRALALAGPTLHVELSDGTLKASVDLADELLVSAFAERAGAHSEAWHALARVLGMTDATIKVERRPHPTAMNIMEPVDQALEVAAQERARSPEIFAEEEAVNDELSGLLREPKRISRPEPAVETSFAAEWPEEIEAKPPSDVESAPRREPKVTPPARPPIPVEATMSAAKGAVSGEAVTGARALPPRARTLVGVGAVGLPTPSVSTQQRPSMPSATLPGGPPTRPRTPSQPPPKRPSMPVMRDHFGDIPTDPAAPGLLQRMARTPANDALPEIRSAAATPPAPPPTVEIERHAIGTRLSELEFEGEGHDYDAGEVTVIADASQLDILRETLERIDEPTKALTSTMPAPPNTDEPEIELVAPTPRSIAEAPATPRKSISTPTPAEQAAAASAFGSIPPSNLQREMETRAARGIQPAPRKRKGPWLAIAVAIAIAAIAVGVYFSGTFDRSKPPAAAPAR